MTEQKIERERLQGGVGLVGPRPAGAGPGLSPRPAPSPAAFSSPEPRAIRFPIPPPPLRNHGNYVVSLARLVQWLGQRAEKAGVNVFTGFAGSALLTEGGRVAGIQTGDKGVDKDGKRKENFQPGYEPSAKG